MKKNLVGSRHTEAQAETKGRCVDFLIIHLNAKNAEFHSSASGSESLVWRSGWLFREMRSCLSWLSWPTADENWETTEAGMNLCKSSNKSSARSKAPGEGCSGSSCLWNSPKTGQIKLFNTNEAFRRAFIIHYRPGCTGDNLTLCARDLLQVCCL